MAYYILGLICGAVICHEFSRYQIVKKRNPDVIAKVRRWLNESNELR